MPGIIVDTLYTHLPFSDATGLTWARDRLVEFATLCADLVTAGACPHHVQAVSSPGLCAGLDDPCNAVAVGSLLFGGEILPQALLSIDSPSWSLR